MGKPLALAAGSKPATGFEAAPVAERSIACAIDGLNALGGTLGNGLAKDFEAAVELMLACKGRVIGSISMTSEDRVGGGFGI